ncbi:MAG TPA: flavodoxin family protein [Thermoplasmata archaeon]
MAVKVLGIMGSPCVDGNTAMLLDAVLEGAKAAGAEVERLNLAKMDIHPCLECRECDSEIGCSQGNDEMPEIYTRIRLVDAIVLASPIFFMGVSAQTKAMIDRCQCFWTEKYVRGIRRYEGRRRPKGLFVSCAGSQKEVVFEPARHVVKAFFAAIDYQYAGEVLLLHTDDPDLGSRRTEALAQARVAGARLCEE